MSAGSWPTWEAAQEIADRRQAATNLRYRVWRLAPGVWKVSRAGRRGAK